MPDPVSGLPPTALPPVREMSMTPSAMPASSATQSARLVTLGNEVKGGVTNTDGSCGSTYIVSGQRPIQPMLTSTESLALAAPSVIVTKISAVPLFAFVAIVMALSAATALVRVLVKVTLVMPVHADPAVRVRPFVVGNENVTPVTPAIEIDVEIDEDPENPLALYAPTT